MIRVRFFAGAAAAAGIDEAVLAPALYPSLRDAVASVVPHSIDEVLNVSSFLLNGELASAERELDARENAQGAGEGDILIDVLPPFAGG